MRREAVPMKVREAGMRLKNETKSIRYMGQTLGLPKSAVWKVIKKKECTGELCDHKGTGGPKKTEESSLW